MSTPETPSPPNNIFDLDAYREKRTKEKTWPSSKNDTERWWKDFLRYQKTFTPKK